MNDEAVRRVREFLDSWLDYRARQVDLPGFSVAVGHHNQIIFSQAYGLACLETAEPLTSRHYFAIGSQTKMLTAVAILQLFEQKKLALDEPIERYLPWLQGHRDKRLRAVTIRQLLSHGAGLIRDGQKTDYWQLRQPFPDAAGLRHAVLSSRLCMAPGEQLKYSNLGYALLGQIVEVVSGTDFTHFASQHLINPFSRGDKIVFEPPALARLATAYGAPYHGQRLPLMPPDHSRAFTPVIGAYATAEQMCRLTATFGLGGGLLTDATKKMAYADHQAIRSGYDEGMTYGLGFEVWQMGGRRVVGHGGHVAGYLSSTYFDPESGLSVAVMGNARDTPVWQMVRGIFEVIAHFEQHARQPVPAPTARLNARVFNSLASVEIVACKDNIVAIDPDDWSPFSFAEELRRVNASTLKVITKGSVFNQGELIRYSFSGDAVQAIRYAGFSLFPERVHRQTMHTSIGVGLDGPVLTLDELQQLDIRLGRIISIEADAQRHGCYKLAADFGAELGRQTALLTQLPPGDLRGQLILGAIYPLWNFGHVTNTILLLGLAPQARGGSLLLPGALLPLTPDPRQPYVAPKQLYWKRAHQHIDRMNNHFFKLEALSEYALEDNEAGASAEAWRQGKYQKAKALMNAEQIHPLFWVRAAQRKSYKSFVRVRIVDKEPSWYLQWELEYYKRVHIPLLKETIFLVPRKKLSNLALPSGDIAIGDDKLIMLNNYQNSRLTHGTFYDANQGHDIQDFLILKNQLLRAARRYGQKL